MTEKWHAVTVDEALNELKSSREGLSVEEASARLDRYGPNAFESKKQESAVVVFLKQFHSPLIYILIFAAGVSFSVGKLTNASVILCVIAVNAVMGFVQETKAKKTMDSLKKLSSPKARVIRQGGETEISSSEIVPGDIIILEAGTKVPADARLIESVRLQVQEAALTGESQPIFKVLEPVRYEALLADRLNIVYSGTIVTAGRGKAVATATGMRTEIGKIAGLVQATPEPKTPFQRKMDGFGKLIILVVSSQVAFAFIVGHFVRQLPFYEVFLVALSQMVSSIPEGLPVAVTVALAVGMQRMAKRKAYIRKLAAVEGLGSATYICSDKTGTLTKNEMTSRKAHTPSSGIFDITGSGYEPAGDFIVGGAPISPLENAEIKNLIKTAALCNNAGFRTQENGAAEISGDPTEIAYLVLAKKAGLDLAAINEQFPRIDEIPFESRIRMMLTKHKTPDGKILICAKGSPETIIDICARRADGDGTAELATDDKMDLRRQSEYMAKDALRVLAFGYGEFGGDEEDFAIEALRGKLVFAGLIGNIDPPREEVGKAIELCRKAGIKTIMITGDHLATAEAIAQGIGIQQQGDEGVTGDILNVMSDEELDAAVKNITVFARIEPKNKFQIVRALQKQNEVVAMTGDGVNDAPALAAADIGVAMGVTGTDVAKESSSMVIADDNFATIVNAVEEGRGITTNIRKTILYLLCSSNTEIIVLLVALASGLPLPLYAIQILWINMVTDGALTINLIMEPKEDVMSRPPDGKNEPIVTKKILGLLFFRAPIMAAGILGLFTYEITRGQSIEYARTVAFTALAVTQWLNGINCRSNRKSIFTMPFFGNKYLVAGLAIAVILHLIIIYTPFLQDIFETVALDIGDWARITAVASMVFWAEEARKFIARKMRERRTA